MEKRDKEMPYEVIIQEEFDDFVNKVDRSQLPEDIRFELK